MHRKFRCKLNILNQDEVLIYLRARLSDVLEISIDRGISIRDLDHQCPQDIEMWLSIFNDVFGRRWRESRYRKRIVEDHNINVLKTFVLTANGEASAVASIGAFLGNPSCAALHYIAVRSKLQGRSLGMQIAAHGCRELSELGYTIVENEIPAHRVHSLKLHHRLGFDVEPGPDVWNTKPIQPVAIQMRALMQTHHLIMRW